MQQNKYLLETGFPQKLNILKRDQSFINDSQQINQNEINKSQQSDNVQRNKTILKIQKSSNLDNNVLKIQNPNRQLIWNNRSSGLNQSVALDEVQQDLNNKMIKLSQSFDLKQKDQKKIIQRIGVKNLIPPRSHSSMDKFVDNQIKNQIKLSKNIQKNEQDKENHDYNLEKLQQNISRNYKKNQQLYQNKFKINEGSIEFNHSNSLNNTQTSFIDSQNQVGIKLATQPNLYDCEDDGIFSTLDLLREQEIFLKNKMLKKKQDNFLSTNEIINDNYFHQDNISGQENKKHLQSLIQNAKKKCADIKHIVSQNLGVSQLLEQDINIKDNKMQNFSKGQRNFSNLEQNLIDIYDRQDTITPQYTTLSQTYYYKKTEQTPSICNYSLQISNNNICDDNQNSQSIINQKLKTEESFYDKNNISKSNIETQNVEKSISFENLIKSEEERIKNSKLQENNKQNPLQNDEQNNIIKSNKGEEQISNEKMQNQVIEQKFNNIRQEKKMIQKQNKNEQQQQIDILQLLEQNIQVKDQDKQEGEKLEILNTLVKQQTKVIDQKQNIPQEVDNQSSQQLDNHRNNHLIGVKNPKFISENLMIQNQFYSQSPINPILSTQATSLTDKSCKSITSNNRYQGQNKQNLVLFQNNKKKEINQHNDLIQLSQNQNSFQMDKNQEVGFSLQNNEKNQQMKKKNNKNGTQPIQIKSQLTSQYTHQPFYQKNQINFNSFLEDFNFDNISIGPNQQMTKSSSKSRRTPIQIKQQLEANQNTELQQQNKQLFNNHNLRTYQNKQVQQFNQISNLNNSFNSTLQNFTPSYVKSSSSMGFQEENIKYQQNISFQQKSHNIQQNPPFQLLSQTQDSFSESLNKQKSDNYNVHGNTMPLGRSNQSRRSTDNQNISFEFHEMKQYPNYRSISQQSSREQASHMNYNTKEILQGSMSIPRNQQINMNMCQFQNFQPSQLNFVPPSCSSAHSVYTNSSRNQKKIMNKLNKNTEITSTKNMNCAQNYQHIMKEIYTEIDEDTRIYDFSPKKIQALKQQNNIQKYSLQTSSNFFDFSNTNMQQLSAMSRTNGGQINSTNDFKIFNDSAKLFLNRIENSRQQGETNTVTNQYMNSLRSRITQLKNKKKNTEIDLILLNTKVISNIESVNTNLKQKLPHHLNKQLEELYQQIKKNIFIYSCQ